MLNCYQLHTELSTEIQQTNSFTNAHIKIIRLLFGVRQNRANYDWLYKSFVDLAEEYTYRYGRKHLSYKKLKNILVYPPNDIEDGDFTQLTSVMPDYCKTLSNSLASYCYYYKKHLDKWTKDQYLVDLRVLSSSRLPKVSYCIVSMLLLLLLLMQTCFLLGAQFFAIGVYQLFVLDSFRLSCLKLFHKVKVFIG